MDEKPKCETKNYKTLEDNIENLGDLVFSNEFLYSSRSMKEIKWT